MVFPPPLTEFEFLRRKTTAQDLSTDAWQEILARVLDPEDLRRVCLTGSFLNDCLENRKKYWQFPLILPYILPYVDLHSALVCRRVCVQWKSSVDIWSEASDLAKAKIPPQLSRMTLPVHLTNAQALADFTRELETREMRNCHLVGGHYMLGFVRQLPHPADPPTLYWNSLAPFLTLWGENVRHLTLKDCDTEMSRTASIYYVYLRLILEKCPNLQSIQWAKCEYPVWNNEFLPISTMITDSIPLPRLSKLEHLEMPVKLWSPVQLTLLKEYGTQIKFLETTLCGPVADLSLRTLEKLQVLTLTVAKTELGDNLLLERLLEIPSMSLKKLKLLLMSSAGVYNWTLQTLLDICGRFNLKEFSVVCEEKQARLPNLILEGTNERRPQRRIPSLTSLQFMDSAGMTTFDFLMCFPNLEDITLVGMYDVRYRDFVSTTRIKLTPEMGNAVAQETLEVRKYLYDNSFNETGMFDSNIWRSLPKLKQFTLRYCLKCEGALWMRRYDIAGGVEDTDNLKVQYTRRQYWNRRGF